MTNTWITQETPDEKVMVSVWINLETSNVTITRRFDWVHTTTILVALEFRDLSSQGWLWFLLVCNVDFDRYIGVVRFRFGRTCSTASKRTGDVEDVKMERS